MADHCKYWQEWGRIRRKCGRGGQGHPFSFATCIVALIGLAVTLGDSPAAATYLDNGVTARDRSGLNIRRPPPPGAPRFGRRAPAPARPAVDTAWFWARVSPRRAAAAPRRFASTLDLVRARRRSHAAVYSPGHLARLGRDWQRPIAAAAARHRISEALVLAVIAVESAGRPRARSPKGAQGLMQLIPATARRFGVADAFDPVQNVAGGVAYLDFLLARFGGDLILALAGYNAGEGAVERHAGVPPYAETRAYVVRVLDALVAAEALCPAPPDGPRAPCPLPPETARR